MYIDEGTNKPFKIKSITLAATWTGVYLGTKS
jgi:hypothetical protein